MNHLNALQTSLRQKNLPQAADYVLFHINESVQGVQHVVHGLLKDPTMTDPTAVEVLHTFATQRNEHEHFEATVPPNRRVKQVSVARETRY